MEFTLSGALRHPVNICSLSGSQLISTVRASKDTFDATFGSTILQAHDGFVAALSPEGNILYISETVSIYLGLSQVRTISSQKKFRQNHEIFTNRQRRSVLYH